MPINRHMTFSDRQAEAARLKKVQQMAKLAETAAPVQEATEAKTPSSTQKSSPKQSAAKAAPKKAAASKPAASKKAAAASKKKSGKGK